MDLLPDAERLVAGFAVVFVAVVLWAVASFVRGSPVRLLEAVLFALVFGAVYLGTLSILGRDTEESS